MDGFEKTVRPVLLVDMRITKVMEYSEIFLTRVMACRRAAKFLGREFNLVIKETKFL